jgi:site-specific DNA recombinase
MRPEAEWLSVDAPHLRIIDETLWEAAHERLRTSRLNYLRATEGKLWGKPANDVEWKYLFTGMSTCGSCG